MVGALSRERLEVNGWHALMLREGCCCTEWCDATPFEDSGRATRVACALGCYSRGGGHLEGGSMCMDSRLRGNDCSEPNPPPAPPYQGGEFV